MSIPELGGPVSVPPARAATGGGAGGDAAAIAAAAGDVARLTEAMNALLRAAPGAPPLPPIAGPAPGPVGAAFAPFPVAAASEALTAAPARALPNAVPLPGEAELRELLSPLLARSLAPVAAAGRSFYFLDQGKPAAPALSHVDAGHDAGRRFVPTSHPPFDVHALRRDFPILAERVNGRPLIWLDNGATTQKPQAVIDRLVHFYRHENSNIHRAAHSLAARATDAYEAARDTVRRFIGASSADEIVFVRGATEAINLVAQSWGREFVRPGDEILITWLEHHANIVPWQRLAMETGARLKVVPVDDHGQVQLDQYEHLLTPRTRLVAFPHVSNALGTVTPAAEMVTMAKRHGACTLIDGAQAVSHMPIDVAALDCDFYAFSGHKVFAPTGIGVLYGKRAVLAAMPPWQGGGNMIRDVTFERTQYQDAPERFEAGTGSIADAVALGAALDYLSGIGMAAINAYERDLLAYATRQLVDIPGLRLIGTAQDKAAVLSFVLDGFRPETIGSALNEEGIAVRAGHHCAQPILRRFGLESTVRPSLAFYNNTSDIDGLVAALRRIADHRSGIG